MLAIAIGTFLPAPLAHAVEQIHRRRLRDEYLNLFLDGVVLKVRDSAGKVRRGWCW